MYHINFSYFVCAVVCSYLLIEEIYNWVENDRMNITGLKQRHSIHNYMTKFQFEMTEWLC